MGGLLSVGWRVVTTVQYLAAVTWAFFTTYVLRVRRAAPADGGTVDGAVFVDTGDFMLRLGGDWRQSAADEAEMYNFSSEAERSSVVISAMPVALQKEKLLEVTRRLLEFRLDNERQLRPDGKLLLGDQWADMVGEDVGQAAYAGYDGEGRIFRFMGWTTQRKILSLWVCTDQGDEDFPVANDRAMAVFGEVFDGLRFHVP